MAEKKETTIKSKTVEKEQDVQAKSIFSTLLTVKDLGLKRCAIKPYTFALWVRALMQNWRQGTVGVKGRSDVALTRKKPWRQKGTGRARAGSARSPLWRGGGVTFGPQPRTRKLKVSQELKKRVLRDLFWRLADEGHLHILDFVVDKPQTKLAAEILKKASLTNKITILVAPQDFAVQSSLANIPTVQLVFFDQLNSFNVAHGKDVVVLKKDMDTFKEMVARWQ